MWNKNISFDEIEIITRNRTKKIHSRIIHYKKINTLNFFKNKS